MAVSAAYRRYLVSFGNYGFTCETTRIPDQRALSRAERDVLVTSFAISAEGLASTGSPGGGGRRPALSLKGATRTRTLRELRGARTAAELASSDLAGLQAAATGMGADPNSVQHLHDLANMVIRLAQS